MITKHKKSLISLAVSITLFSTSLHAQNSDKIVESIMKLRGDVESLYTKIDENKVNHKAQMKSIALQVADSEAQINRKTTSIKLADLELQKIKVKIANTSTSNIELKPLLHSSFDLLETSIKEGIPFKVPARLSALNKIKSELKEGLITQEKALALLWVSYDDNIRLTKEIGLFKQNIKVDGVNVLAQVAKIGSVMMYFSTPNNKVGYVVKDSTAYSYKVATNEEDIKNIVALYDALQKNIRTGYFTLPNALILKGAK
ncbi:MAG: DUF3450 family protein [Campylobacterota bacterium]|nr:DUF3450 family protein [Campylobacterota bacterium]